MRLRSREDRGRCGCSSIRDRTTPPPPSGRVGTTPRARDTEPSPTESFSISYFVEMPGSAAIDRCARPGSGQKGTDDAVTAGDPHDRVDGPAFRGQRRPGMPRPARGTDDLRPGPGAGRVRVGSRRGALGPTGDGRARTGLTPAWFTPATRSAACAG